MTLRGRIAVTAAAAVAVAMLLAFVGLYLVTARTLVGEVDRSLAELVPQVGRRALLEGVAGREQPGRFGGAGGYVQAVDPNGHVLGEHRADALALPVTERTRAVAGGEEHAFLSTMEVDGERYRVFTSPTRFNLAVQVARPLAEVDATLRALRRRLVVAGVLGIALAGGLGAAVARRAVRPVHALTRVAEEVAATRDLSRRIEVTSEDEVGRLAASFNVMLAALQRARAAQEQLVADASHELRTPLTSLRTNIEVLATERLEGQHRRELLDDVVVQLDEFGRLVTSLVELARGDQPARAAVRVRLDELVERVVARARAFAGDDVRVALEATPTMVTVEEDRVETAVANLLDNAVKHGGGDVEVAVAGGTVTVRDHGSGIPVRDLPCVFDRFYRAPEARSAPGSGLGLSIVAQVAASHGGTVTADNAPDGGAVLCLQLPEVTPDTR